MNFWEKLISNPEVTRAPIGSPLVRALLGLGLLFFAVHTVVTDAIRISRAGDGIYLHFSDHPKTFVVTCIGSALAALWALRDARKRYRMHEKKVPTLP